jgi:hypothetical protein
MLPLLLRTRLRYYRNYLRHHFDRAARIEIGIIILIAFYLAGRSPTDIGYSLEFVQEADFPQRFAAAWISLLPVFYLTSEALALMTLRPTGEWQLLGALPLSRQAITNYHLLRHAGKLFLLMLIGTLPFYVGDENILVKFFHFLTALGILLTLQVAGFRQAHQLRSFSRKVFRRIFVWLPTEVLIVSATIASAFFLQKVFFGGIAFPLVSTLFVWGILAAVLFYLYRSYQPSEAETVPASKKIRKARSIWSFVQKTNVVGALIVRDIQLLWRRQRSAYFLFLVYVVIASIPIIAHATPEDVYASSIAVQIVFSWLLINSLLTLFEYDVESLGLIKSLPVKPKKLWWSRWRLTAGLIIAPMLIPIFLAPIKHSLDLGFPLFIFFAVMIVPAVFATLYCNAGFGMFPQIKYGGIILNISLLLMLLFWFFMPFGTPLLLAVMLFWIRKSQKHFRFLETA